MSDIHARIDGRLGRITLTRPQALNALTYEMIIAIEEALDLWREEKAVSLILIDAEGEKAFCAGGDIQAMYTTASAGDFDYGRRFWRDEYRLNAKIYNYPKPYVAMMQGFTMGGGVGIACHGSHRVVCESSRVAMPECSIGLVPDVGGSLLLARAPGRLGEYLGMTGTRMGPADAIFAGFADYFVPRDNWDTLISDMARGGDLSAVDRAARPPPPGALKPRQATINAHFAGETAQDIMRSFGQDDWSQVAAASLRRGCPLSVACTTELVHRARGLSAIRPVLMQEYRFTYRSASDGDFVEGIRASVIDRDHSPKWQHGAIEDVSAVDVSRMLMPLGEHELKL